MSNFKKNTVCISSDLEEIMPNFLTNRQNDISNITQAISSSDFETIKMIAHKMAGSSGSYGLHQIGEYGKLIELAAKEENINDIKKNLLLLEDYFSSLEIKFED